MLCVKLADGSVGYYESGWGNSQQLKWGKEYSEKIGAPLITSEVWASWFYIDHPDLKWEWLLDWCEAAVDDAIEFGLWGITTNNYAEPHFE